jgi:hypothetical protein
MSDLKKHFISLFENVDQNYQSPFDANSGQGITKFAPTPAEKVIGKSYNVDGDFLRKAIGYGGVAQQAVDQIMGGIDGQQCDGPLCGNHFDTIIGGFTGAPDAPTTDAPIDAEPVVVEPTPEVPPVDGDAAPPVNAEPGEGIPQNDDDAAINAKMGEPVAPPEEMDEGHGPQHGAGDSSHNVRTDLKICPQTGKVTDKDNNEYEQRPESPYWVRKQQK